MLEVDELNSDQIREELLHWIALRQKFLADDTRTYWVSKLQRVFGTGKLGGGNMPIAAGALSCLEYYAAINAHLSGSNDVWTLNSVEKYRKAVSKLNECSAITKSDQDRILRPEPAEGEMRDAAGAVHTLLSKLVEFNPACVSGLPLDDLKLFRRLWKAFRNHLAHTMTPQLGCAVGALTPKVLRRASLTIAKALDFEQGTPNPAFNLNDQSCWQLDGDVLAMCMLPYVVQMLGMEITANTNSDQLKSALRFARGEFFSLTPS